jgi:hypothetical protein
MQLWFAESSELSDFNYRRLRLVSSPRMLIGHHSSVAAWHLSGCNDTPGSLPALLEISQMIDVIYVEMAESFGGAS